MNQVEFIIKEVNSGNIFCSHSSKYFTKERYNAQGKQTGRPTDIPSITFLKCNRIGCSAEFDIVQENRN